MPDNIKILMVRPGEQPVVTEVGNDLHSVQAAVGGLIEVYPLDDNTLLICNEEGKINGLPGNRRMDNGDIIAGNFFIAGDGGKGDFTSLTDDQIAEYADRFDAIEQFEPSEVQDTLDMRFCEW